MRLRYRREQVFGRIRCLCDSDHVNAKGVSLLTCLLMDDGGTGTDSTIMWLQKGMAMVQAVSSGKSPNLFWDREDWGAEIRADEVIIYSQHDDSWIEAISIVSFGRALSSWYDFLVADDLPIGEIREIVL